MNYQKAFYLISIFTFLGLLLLTIISWRFLGGEWRKVQEVNPEILAQYNITLEVDKFIQLVKELKKNNPWQGPYFYSIVK